MDSDVSPPTIAVYSAYMSRCVPQCHVLTWSMHPWECVSRASEIKLLLQHHSQAAAGFGDTRKRMYIAYVDARQQRQQQEGAGSTPHNQLKPPPPPHLGTPARCSDMSIKQHSTLTHDSTRESRITRPHTRQDSRLGSQACSMHCHKHFQAGRVFELHHGHFHTMENSGL